MIQAHTLQSVPGTVEVDAQEAVETSMPDFTNALMFPLILTLAGGGALGHLLSAWLSSKSAVKKDIEDMRVRLETLSGRVQRLEHTGSRKARIAHLALDRVQDWENYFLRRDETRNQEDPDHAVTPWVPEPPPRLRDSGWVSRHRDELLELDELT